MALSSAWVTSLLASAVLSSAVLAQVATKDGEGVTLDRHEAKWYKSRWRPCSMSCGGGVQRRATSCYFANGTKGLPSDCRSQRPAEVKSCDPKDCPPEVYFVPGPCAQTCGGGYRIPYRRCRHINAQGRVQELPAFNCSHLTRRLYVLKSCRNSPPCKPFYQVGEWSPCSATCGTGRQSRRVTCRQYENMRNKSVAQRHCRRLLGRMRSTRLCHKQNYCENDFKWLPGKWSLCKVNCEKHRHVRCFSEKDNHYTDEKFCEKQEKPAAMQKCVNMGSYTWQANKWRPCSVTCGQGIQTRHVYCAHGLTGQWARSCPLCMKPADARRCDTHTPCNTANHQGVQERCIESKEEKNSPYCKFLESTQSREQRLFYCKSGVEEFRVCRSLCDSSCDNVRGGNNDARPARQD